ncbi:MAG: hypothetical protein KGJ62_00485 [Armatimonadetes bacterium]|nr:hypothetical protein [Armatimonadota bacterium]MDE2205179.1 hypothetical protein [Armatimonadota bacterium]
MLADTSRRLLRLGRLAAVIVGAMAVLGNPVAAQRPSNAKAAHDYWMSLRTFGSAGVNWNDYGLAVQAANQMNRPGGTRAGNSLSGVLWQFLGPINYSNHYQWGFGVGSICGRVNGVAYSSLVPGTMFAATAGGGVMRTTDGGLTWTPLSDNWPTLYTSCVTVDPSNPNIVWVGTGDFDAYGAYSAGVMKSTDGGDTWEQLGVGEFDSFPISSISIDPENHNAVNVEGGRGPSALDGSVWRTTDGGVSWNRYLAQTGDFTDLQYSRKLSTGQRWLWTVATYTSATGGTTLGGLWRSLNNGATWQKVYVPNHYLGGSGRLRIATSVTDANTLYVASGPANGGLTRVAVTHDAGTNWADITGNLNPDTSQQWYDFYMTNVPLVTPTTVSDFLYMGLIDVVGAPPGGSWFSVDQAYTGNDLFHVDQHGMAVDPQIANEFAVANDGGVWSVKLNHSTGVYTPTSLSGLLRDTQIYHADWGPTDPDDVIFGAQDNGSAQLPSSSGSWDLVSGGDGGGCAINWQNPSIVYSTSQFGAVYRNGVNIGPSNPTGSFGFVTPITIDPVEPDLVYTASTVLYLWNDVTSTWTADAQAIGGAPATCIAVAYPDDYVIYTGSADGQVWVTSDSGLTWRQVNGSGTALPVAAITAIKIDPADPFSITVGLSGFGYAHVWRCLDTTAATPLFTPISGSGAGTTLPDIPVDCLALDVDQPQQVIYAGTDIGMFVTTDGGNTWQNATNSLGLPNVQVNELKEVPGTRYLNAATYGRGIWRIKIPYQDYLRYLTINPAVIAGDEDAIGTVTLYGQARPTGATISLTSSEPTVLSVPATVTVPGGQESVQFPVTTSFVTSEQTVTVTATGPNAAPQKVVVKVEPFVVTSLLLASPTVQGGNPTSASVTINYPAPSGGLKIGLGSTNVAASVPTSVTIPVGTTSATFTIGTQAVTSDQVATISATYTDGSYSSSKSQTLVVEPVRLLGLAFASGTVISNTQVKGTVSLNGPAPNGGAVVALQSGNSGAFPVPATVTVPAGKSQVTFTVTAGPVPLDLPVTVTATYLGASAQAVINVVPPALQSVAVTPSSIVSTLSGTGTVTLTAPALAGGALVYVKSSNPAVLTVPGELKIPFNSASQTFGVTTTLVSVPTPVTITATYLGVSVSFVVTVEP